MHRVSHEEKVLWEVYCQYRKIGKTLRFNFNPYTYDLSPGFHRISGEGWDFLRRHHYYCVKIWKVCDWDFDTFVDKMENGVNNPYGKYARFDRRRKTGNPGVRRRKYRRKKHHKKKEWSEKAELKKEWRKSKKDRRDQHRSGFGSKSYKKFSIKKGRRAERRDIKTALGREDWSEYGRGWWIPANEGENSWEYGYRDNPWDNFREKGRKNFVDPWDWW